MDTILYPRSRPYDLDSAPTLKTYGIWPGTLGSQPSDFNKNEPNLHCGDDESRRCVHQLTPLQGQKTARRC